ncbi:androgen-induced protein 1-related [Anaeramoeba flamelloides]|uniref:Androgen-induced protein 1-related n=1 Tax=Anaeramoeba flamelloides TaxID=1746091 RepID=A0AAV7YGV5_9EUKA|nr:androgen-induced protein 1-related [Anaeramoeba flamelloides]
MKLIITTIWSFIATLLCFYAWYNLHVYGLLKFKLQVQFFTKWSFAIETIYFLTSTLKQLYVLIFDRKKGIRQSKFFALLFSLAASCTTIAGIMFWVLAITNRKLLENTAIIPNQPPIFVHHLFHTMSLILWIIELIILPNIIRTIPSNFLVLGSIFIVALSYGSQSKYTQLTTGGSAYPFLDKFSLVQWIIFFAITTIVGFVLQKFVLWIISLRIPKGVNEAKKSNPQKNKQANLKKKNSRARKID